MRYVLTATVAASALALSIGFGPAAALSPAGNSVDTGGVLHKVQHTERGKNAGRDKAGPSRDGMRSGDRGRDRGPRTEFRSERRDGHRHRYRHSRPGVDLDIHVGPGYGYVSECDWLRRRAIATGSRYWWRRYRACING